MTKRKFYFFILFLQHRDQSCLQSSLPPPGSQRKPIEQKYELRYLSKPPFVCSFSYFRNELWTVQTVRRPAVPCERCVSTHSEKAFDSGCCIFFLYSFRLKCGVLLWEMWKYCIFRLNLLKSMPKSTKPDTKTGWKKSILSESQQPQQSLLVIIHKYQYESLLFVAKIGHVLCYLLDVNKLSIWRRYICCTGVSFKSSQLIGSWRGDSILCFKSNNWLGSDRQQMKKLECFGWCCCWTVLKRKQRNINDGFFWTQQSTIELMHSVAVYPRSLRA